MMVVQALIHNHLRSLIIFCIFGLFQCPEQIRLKSIDDYNNGMHYGIVHYCASLVFWLLSFLLFNYLQSTKLIVDLGMYIFAYIDILKSITCSSFDT